MDEEFIRDRLRVETVGSIAIRRTPAYMRRAVGIECEIGRRQIGVAGISNPREKYERSPAQTTLT